MEFKLKDIAHINQETLKKDSFPNNFLYLDTKNLTSGKFGELVYFDTMKDKVPSRARRIVKENDILISTVRPNQRHYGFITKDQESYIVSTGFAVITPDETKVNPYFLYKYLTLENITNYLQSIAENSTSAYPAIKPSVLSELSIILPDKTIQGYISKLLRSLDDKMNLNEQIIANLEELSQTLFKRWFVDFEFPDENGNPYKSSGGEMIDSELGEIPSGWKVDELGNYIKIKSGKRPKNKVDKKDIENVVPIIGASKIMGYTNDYLYNEKIIIIGRVGTHGVIQRFSTRTWPSDNTFVIISDFESIIYQVLKSIDYISLNRGSTQPLLSQKDIKNTKVAMPTNETLLSTYQKENNHILKMMDQKNIENQKLTQLRDTLLPKLMSGEIEIPDDIEVNEDELSI
ncbi:TPA: restriction endonuclease subunit S [Staphylococcus aureus]|nr:restriction endonuclease subunit S [Staphylococcus aureus]HEH0657435.1 restriction endonuclease subunit S [Staphylococcus aureus]HEH1184918.1 restriction endonuclease subunit S [Staphylococcus aureus]HEH3006333.1 restriction endonuclease subunit S [Staphylococcus aureus]HEH3391695.1 restriction endonuclease subunit S [Staphylococcus aureus]